MKIAFIGMSGVGKSYWAKQLAQAGWCRLDCDAMIAQQLHEVVHVTPDEEPVHAVGKWMGMPWTDRFADRESQYLELEKRVTQTAIAKANEVTSGTEQRDVVIDTTGSVIYTGDKVLNHLKQTARVVYLDVPDQVREQMVKLYLREPKPVLWRGGFKRRPDESDEAALARCYANLLRDRTDQYSALADVVIDYHTLRAEDMGIDQFIKQLV